MLSQNPKKSTVANPKAKTAAGPNSLPIGRSWILIDLTNFRCRNKTFHRIEFYDLFRTIQTHHKLISKHNFITSSVIDVSENSDPSMTKSEKPKYSAGRQKLPAFSRFFSWIFFNCLLHQQVLPQPLLIGPRSRRYVWTCGNGLM